MNKENIYLVLLLVVGIVVLSNLAMFALVRGSRHLPFDWFKRGDTFTQSFKGENSSLNELRQRVQGLAREEQAKAGQDE